MYKINYNNKIFPKNKKFENKNNKFKIDSIKSLTIKEIKLILIYDITSRLL